MSLLPIQDIAGAHEGGLASIFLLAVLQGIAEFLPISSSGHLVVARLMLGVHEAGMVLDVALHVGTLAAVAYAYRRDVQHLFRQLFAGQYRLMLWLVLATIPVAIAGMTAKHLLETVFQSTHAVAGALLGTATILMIGEFARRKHQPSYLVGESALGSEVVLEPRYSDALFIGVAQVLALIPGVSRSGTTIAAGLLRGLSPAQAARLSFLMSLPAVTGAALVELPEALSQGFGAYSGLTVLAATTLAGLVGFLALRTLLVVVRRGAFVWFALYCGLLGAGLLAFT